MCVGVTLGIQRAAVVCVGICRLLVLSDRNYDFYWKRKCHPVVSEVRKVCLTSGFSSRNSRRPSRDVRVCVAGTYSTALITSYLPSFATLPQNIQSVFLLTVSSGVVKTFRIYKLVSPLTAKKPSHPGSGTGTFWLRFAVKVMLPSRSLALWQNEA